MVKAVSRPHHSHPPCCSFLALSLHQGAANGGKRRHTAKVSNRRILRGMKRDPATSSTPRKGRLATFFPPVNRSRPTNPFDGHRLRVVEARQGNDCFKKFEEIEESCSWRNGGSRIRNRGFRQLLDDARLLTRCRVRDPIYAAPAGPLGCLGSAQIDQISEGILEAAGDAGGFPPRFSREQVPAASIAICLEDAWRPGRRLCLSRSRSGGDEHGRTGSSTVRSAW